MQKRHSKIWKSHIFAFPMKTKVNLSTSLLFSVGSAEGGLQKQLPKAIPIWPISHKSQPQKKKFWRSEKLKKHFPAIYLHKQGRCSEHKL